MGIKIVEADGCKKLVVDLPPTFEGGGLGADSLNLDAVDWKAVLKALAPVLISILQKLAA